MAVPVVSVREVGMLMLHRRVAVRVRMRNGSAGSMGVAVMAVLMPMAVLMLQGSLVQRAPR